MSRFLTSLEETLEGIAIFAAVMVVAFVAGGFVGFCICRILVHFGIV